ncbi:hypothetical protein [Bacillus sp. FJAT-22090]|uniref:hypothetical protein n=1 Tax=Bacillus sp. FJAT-22090 TaxID=1581038 RepID=UPI0011A69B65|nr:hypothetical protein [Bacillus sp. FJAT-22090]
MNNRESNNKSNQNSNSLIRAAELALVGELLSTIGDVISTISAVLALEEERQEQSESKNVQEQLDYLTNEIKILKKQINDGKSRRF